MNPVLVTGATGTVGAHVVRELRRRQTPVRAFVRDPEKANRLLGPEVELAVGDFGDPAALRAAVDGVERVFLACANHPQQVPWETAVVDAAAAAGVRHVVKLSAFGAYIGSPVAFLDANGRIEHHLRRSGVAWTLLRPTFLMANLLRGAGGVRSEDAFLVPGADAEIALVDPRDVAEVAAVVLTGAGHAGRHYDLTGPAPVTFDDVAEHLSAVLGRRIDYVALSDDQATTRFTAAGAPPWYVANVVRLFDGLRRGAQAEVRDTVGALRRARPARRGSTCTRTRAPSPDRLTAVPDRQPSSDPRAAVVRCPGAFPGPPTGGTVAERAPPDDDPHDNDTPPDQVGSTPVHARRAGSPSPPSPERRSSSTTSSCTAPPPRWCSARSSSPPSAPWRAPRPRWRPSASRPLVRPVGAVVFGHLGDRLGRKRTLIYTLLLMGLASVAVGLLPGTAAIGGAAPAVLVALRVLQGIAVGGEWGGAALLAVENARPGRRAASGCTPSSATGSRSR